MSERYSRLYTLPAKSLVQDAPVIVAAGALLRDNEKNTVLVQLKLQNLSVKPAVAVTVVITPLDGEGNPAGDITEHTYRDFVAEQDVYFGDREPIMLENPETKKFSVSVEEILFFDRSIWPGMGYLYDDDEMLPPIEEEEGDENTTNDDAASGDEESEAPLAEQEPEKSGASAQEAAEEAPGVQEPEEEEPKVSEAAAPEATDAAVSVQKPKEPEPEEAEASAPDEQDAVRSVLQEMAREAKTAPAAGQEGKPKKEKKKANTALLVAILAIVVIVVVVIGCGVTLGWFGSGEETAQEAAAEAGTSSGSAATASEDEMTMEDYTTIEIAQSVVDAVDDDLVQDAIDTMLSSYATTEYLTEGTVEEGDTIYISYVGTLDGVAFDGGTSDGTTIVVGSSGYIDGFDDGLIGASVGETVELDLTFPEDYSAEDLAGQDVVFTVTIEYMTETVTPEFDDEFAAEYSYEYWGEQVNTADELYNYIYDYYYTYYLHSAMLEALQEKQTVISYGQENYELLYSYAYEEVSYYASYYGMDADTLATYYGYDDADAYAADEAEYYAGLIMLFDYLWEDLGLEPYTEEDVDNALEEYIEQSGYSSYYTLEEFKEAGGEAWLLIYEGIEFRYDTIMYALEDRVVFTED